MNPHSLLKTLTLRISRLFEQSFKSGFYLAFAIVLNLATLGESTAAVQSCGTTSSVTVWNPAEACEQDRSDTRGSCIAPNDGNIQKDMWGGWDSCESGSDSNGQYRWFITWTFSHPIYYSYRHKYYFCPDGYVGDNGSCACPEGTIEENGTCVEPITCDEGFVEVNGSCACPEGTVEENGTCVEPITCDEGFVEVNGACIQELREESMLGDHSSESGGLQSSSPSGTSGNDSTQGRGQNGAHSTNTCNPINFATGNKYFHATDYRGTGSFPIVFGRSYNSYALGWRYAYTQRVDRLSATEVVVRRPGGQSFDFRLVNGQWLPDPDVIERLEALTGSSGNLTGWRYRVANNKQESFDANGRMTSVRNASGLEQTLTYSADGKQFLITDPQGDTLLVTLDNNGLAKSIEDIAGRVTSFDYNGNYLSKVSYPSGTTKQYLYEESARPWLITGIIDENGNRSNTVAYDEQGRAIMSELANGVERVEVSYNADGTTTLTNALGKRSTFTFETIHGVKKIVHVEGEPTATCQGTAMDYTFNDNGFLIEKVDAKGIVTRYTRDENGLALSRTEAAGALEERTTTTEWDTERRLPLTVTGPKSITTYRYDGHGRLLGKSVTAIQ